MDEHMRLLPSWAARKDAITCKHSLHATLCILRATPRIALSGLALTCAALVNPLR